MDKVVVFDIDGTLANIEHRRHWVANKPKNWKAFNAGMERDTVHEDIVFLLKTFYGTGTGHRVILCSGRGSETRDRTVAWMDANQIPFHALYMRRAGDYRQDSIVKVELLEEIRRDYGNPYVWFDDRTQVVDAIRAQGVRVLQVAPGDF